MEKTFDIAVWRDGAKRPEKLSVECKLTGKTNVWKGHCPLGTHQDKNPSFFVYEDDKQWHCYGCPGNSNHGVLFDEKYNKGNSKGRKWGELVEEYPYINESGVVLKVVERRKNPKDFPVKRPDPDNKGRWIWNQTGIPEILYNLPELVKRPKGVIALVEGERIANRLNDYGILTTTTAGGAKRPYDEANNKYFKDRKGIVLFPDNNTAGAEFMEARGDAILKINEKVKWIDLPGLGPDEDLGDWLNSREEGMSKKEIKDELKGLIKYADMYLKHKLIKERILNKIKENTPIEERECITLYELRRSELPAKKMLLGNGLIPIKGFGLIGGLTKEGKTTFGLQMALCLISGNHFLEDFKVIKKCRILYLYHENDIYFVNDKIEKLMKGFAETEKAIREEDEKNLHIINAQDYTFDSKKPEVGALRKIIAEIKPDIIFIDPLSLFVDSDLTKSDPIKKLRDFLKDICNCFWMIIHHYIKPSYLSKGTSDIPPIYKLLGSSYLANMCDTFIGMEREGESYSEENKILHFKIRWERTPIPMHLYRNPETLLYEPVDSVSLLRGKITAGDIMRVLEESFKGVASYKDLSRLCQDHFGVTDSAVAHKLKEAKEAGMVFKEVGHRGLWNIKDPEKLL